MDDKPSYSIWNFVTLNVKKKIFNKNQGSFASGYQMCNMLQLGLTKKTESIKDIPLSNDTKLNCRITGNEGNVWVICGHCYCLVGDIGAILHVMK